MRRRAEPAYEKKGRRAALILDDKSSEEEPKSISQYCVGDARNNTHPKFSTSEINHLHNRLVVSPRMLNHLLCVGSTNSFAEIFVARVDFIESEKAQFLMHHDHMNLGGSLTQRENRRNKQYFTKRKNQNRLLRDCTRFIIPVVLEHTYFVLLLQINFRNRQLYLHVPECYVPVMPRTRSGNTSGIIQTTIGLLDTSLNIAQQADITP